MPRKKQAQGVTVAIHLLASTGHALVFSTLHKVAVYW